MSRLDLRFDAAMAAVEGWRLDARLYVGHRRQLRLDHARRMEWIAARFVGMA